MAKARRGASDPTAPQAAVLGPDLSYGNARNYARHADPEVRRALAARNDIAPEILFYLAGDPDPSVRRAIAANQITPRHADVVLSRDGDENVRADLARKIGRLAPDLSADEQDNLRALTLEALQSLAEDTLPRVRAIIAEEVKRLDTVPRELINRMARDVELIVAAPILEFSPLLSDEDLREIIESAPVRGALIAISRRVDLSEDISESIADTGDVEAIAELLANQSAQIREQTLDRLIDRAPDHIQWHEPLVMRPHLSARAVRRISRFVTAALLAELEMRNPAARQVTDEVAKRVGERLDDPEADERETAAAEVLELSKLGALDETIVNEWLEAGRNHHVVFALACLAQLQSSIVEAIVGTGDAKAITALAWRAGLSMRTAIELQRKLGKIPASSLIYAKDGVDYPLDEAEMAWRLEIFTD